MLQITLRLCQWPISLTLFYALITQIPNWYPLYLGLLITYLGQQNILKLNSEFNIFVYGTLKSIKKYNTT